MCYSILSKIVSWIAYKRRKIDLPYIFNTFNKVSATKLYTDTIPVIIFHVGRSWYLKFTINQAKKYNKNVFLITDSENAKLYPDSVSMEYFSTSAIKLFNAYKHRSTNPFFIEFLCFARWLIIFEFMRYNSIKYAFTCDSDVMLYSDINQIASNLPPHKASYILIYGKDHKMKKATAGIAFWDIEMLEMFCDFILNLFLTEEGNELLENYWEKYRYGMIDNISDMLTAQLFAEKHHVINLAEIRNNSSFDHNISLSENDVYSLVATKNEYFTMLIKHCLYLCNKLHLYSLEYLLNWFFSPLYLKKIIWIDGLPYAIKKSTGEAVKMHCLHFHGRAKKYIKRYSTSQKT